MKSIIKYFLLTVFGSIGFVLLLVVIVFLLLLIPKGDPVFGEKQAKALYTEQKAAFETVREFIDDFDLTPYENGQESKWYLFVLRNNAEDAEKSYCIYCSDYRDYLPIEIDDQSVINALDVLFDQAKIVSIRRSDESDAYFALKEYAGVVYSKNGETPTETAPGYYYDFRPMNGNWFYWYCGDD